MPRFSTVFVLLFLLFFFFFFFAKHIFVGRLIVQHTSNTITCSHSFILHSVKKRKKVYVYSLNHPLQFDMFMTYIYECRCTCTVVICLCTVGMGGEGDEINRNLTLYLSPTHNNGGGMSAHCESWGGRGNGWLSGTGAVEVKVFYRRKGEKKTLRERRAAYLQFIAGF